MATITTYYWHTVLPGLKYRHGEEMQKTSRKLTAIIKTVTNCGYSLMIRPEKDSDNINVFIDNGRFGQQ